MQVAAPFFIGYNEDMFFSVITILFVVLFLIASIPILLIELLVKKINPMAADMSQLRIVQWAMKVVLFLSRAKVTVIGADRVPDGEPVLFIANHQSYFDIIISYSRMKNRTGFIGKKDFQKVPILSTYMKRLYCLFIGRGDIRQGFETIMKAIDQVKNGISMYICPEGTRNKTGDDLALGPFHDASFKIAQRTGCPIVPVAFNNAADIFEKHFPALKAAHVIVEYGEPVRYGDLPQEARRHIGEYFRDQMLETLKKNQKLV